MNKKTLNVGTIGHVSNGKTLLAKAIARAGQYQPEVIIGANPALKEFKPEILEADVSTQNGQYEEQLRILLLSWNIAKAEGLCEAAAIQRTARKLRDRTEIKKLKNLMIGMLKCKDNARLIASLESMQKSLEENGVIFTGAKS